MKASLKLSLKARNTHQYGRVVGMDDVEASVGDDQSKAKLYRRRAAEILAAAEGMTDSAQRALLFQIAADYHKLALALEEHDSFTGG